MSRLLRHPEAADTRLVCAADGKNEEPGIPVHSCVIAARSDVLADMIRPLEPKPDDHLDNSCPTDSPDVRFRDSKNRSL